MVLNNYWKLLMSWSRTILFAFALTTSSGNSGVIMPASNVEANVSLAEGFSDEIGERKSSDDTDALYSSWMEFLTIRSNQSAEFNTQFPVDGRLYGNVRACGRPQFMEQKQEFESVDTLTPEMIEIYAEIGHLSTFCADENPPQYGTLDPKSFFTQLDKTQHVMQASREVAPTAFDLQRLADEFTKRCVSSLQSTSRQPSLARILQAAGANRLEVFETIAAHDGLQAWTRSIINSIIHSENYDERWKFIILAPGIPDIPLGGTSTQLVDDVTQSLELIHDRLPIRTYVVLLRDAGFNFWGVVDNRFSFCEKVRSLWRFNTTASVEKWRTLQSRIESNYQTYKNFYVQIVEMMEGASPVYSRNKGLDISVLSADCIHLSSRGVSLLHTHLWNRLVQVPTRHSHRQRSKRGLQLHRHHCRQRRLHRSAKDAQPLKHKYSHTASTALALEYQHVHGEDRSSSTAFASLPRQPSELARSSTNEDAWTPLVRALFCPRPKCPYLITERNRKFCARIAQLRQTLDEVSIAINRRTPWWDGWKMDFSQWSVQPTIFALLILSVTLYAALAFYIFCLR